MLLYPPEIIHGPNGGVKLGWDVCAWGHVVPRVDLHRMSQVNPQRLVSPLAGKGGGGHFPSHSWVLESIWV